MRLTIGHIEEEGEWVQDLKVTQTFTFQRKLGPRSVEKRVQVTLSAGGRTEMCNSSLRTPLSYLLRSVLSNKTNVGGAPT